MSEYLRQTADHISWLMRERRGEVADTRRLAAHINRILHRRSRFKGLVGILGADDVKAVAGILRPKPLPPLEPPPSTSTQQPQPAAEPVSTPASEPAAEPVEAPGTDDVGVIAQQLEEALEPTPVQVEEAASPPVGPELAAQAAEPTHEPAPEPDAAQDEEAAVGPAEEPAPSEPTEEPAPSEPVEPHEDTAADVELHVREAAAEAAAVEGIQLEAEAPEQDAAEQAAPTTEPSVEVPAVPGTAPRADDVPFEAAVEPQRLIPAELAFAQAADEVVFRRAIDTLGSGSVRGVREGVEMLGRVPDDAAAAVLMNLYRIAPPRWRPDVVHQLVGHPGAGIAPFFCQVLDDEDEPAVVRGAALRGLYSRDRALAADYLLKALGDPDEDVRATAATYLGWLRDKRAIPLLEQLLGDSSQRVAKAALHAASLIQR